ALEEADGADLSIARLIQGQPPEMYAAPLQPRGLAMIMGTGGTTGRSKGVMLSHRNLTATMANHMSAMNITDCMTVLAAAPITHTAGLVSLPFMARGGRVVLMDGIDPQNLLKVIEQERVN
ncbi:AMP-binding protein, partial [Listeria seeligeri]